MTVYRVDRVELSLAKPGGGEASRESELPTSLLACPSGGWPLNLLEVRIVGTKVVYRVDKVDRFDRVVRVDSVDQVDTCLPN